MKKGTKIIKKPIDVFNSFYFTHNAVALWKEYCADNDVEFSENSIDWDYVRDVMDMEMEDVVYQISQKFWLCDFVVSGYLGLWNGRPRINNRIFGSFKKALDACLSSADDVVISYDNWGFYIDVFHHDGTNTFTISPIKPNISLSAEMIEKFNPYKHKRLIRRIDNLWE